MSEDGTDIADAPVDTSADVSTPDTTDYAAEPVDLAEAPPEPDVPEIEEAPPAEDLSEPPADDVADVAEAPTEAEEAVDLSAAPETGDVAAEEPQDWQEGEVVDVGHDQTPDAPQEAAPAEVDDLGAPDVNAPEDAATQEVDELTDAAREEARPVEELRAEYDADVADTLAEDVAVDASADLGNSPDNDALTSALAEKELTLEPVERFDYSDNPILGYRESAPPEDVAYAVNAWNDEIAPGIAAGATREDFAAYDREHGLKGQRQLAGVYDYMLGDPIHGDVRADGTLDPGGGRHRLEQASLNGVKYVPFKTDGSKA